MKLLHTADWHLCDRLGKLNRTATLRERVERVAAYCEEHAVEVLLVAGDLFYEKASEEEIAESFAHIHRTFQTFFARGGTIVAITGNHDVDSKIQLVRSGTFLAAPISTGELQRGRLYLQNGLTFAKFTSASGERLQLVLVPYPHASRYGLPDTYHTREEEFRRLQHCLAEWMTGVRSSAEFDVTLPTVLMAHLHIRGANLNTHLFRFSSPNDIQMEPADLMSGWAYVALGHIHLPQSIGGVETIRYPGPLDRLDFGEATDERGVILVEIADGNTTTQWLPLDATPFYEFTIDDPDAELPMLAEKYPDRDRAIFKIHVKQSAETKLSRDEISRKIRVIFPHLFMLDFPGEIHETEESSSRSGASSSGKAFTEIVREYVGEQLGTDRDRAEVLELCEQFLAIEREGAAS